MRNQDYIDAEFEVIHPAQVAFERLGLLDTFESEPPRISEPVSKLWTFLDDDLPNLAGIAGGFAVAIALALFWPR